MTQISKEEFDHIISDPSASYTIPDDVLTDNRLTREQKISVLKQWAYDARELQVAEEENMGAKNGSPTRLQQVMLALHKIEEAS